MSRLSFGAKLLLGSAIVLVAAVLGLYLHNRESDTGSNEKVLVMYCAAGVKPPVSEAAKRFEAEYGVKVQLQYGGSGTLLSSLQVSKIGDLYLAGDSSYTEIGREKGLLAEVLPVAHMTPVIAVRKGNPKGIKSLDDLVRGDVRVAFGNPEAASIGKQSRKLLQAGGHWEAIKARVDDDGVFKPTVPEIANDVKLGAVDAGIVWDATVEQYPELEPVHVSQLDKARKNVMVAVLKSSRQPTLALRFARYLNSEIGNEIFHEAGYEAVDGDRWAWKPEITFFAGAVNRRAVEKTLEQFQQREGVVVNTIYNGCGILTGQMRTIRQKDGAGFPDAYMACDRYYLDNVEEWFQDDINVSTAAIVIVVPEGNPKGIKSLADLAKPGLRVAVGQPQQCTIGALTRMMLESEGLCDDVMENVVTQTTSSSLLVPAVTTQSVDAAIAYETDTLAETERVDAILITSKKAKAVQPFATAKNSDFVYLCRRLREAILASREEFEQAGFTFLQKKDTSAE